MVSAELVPSQDLLKDPCEVISDAIGRHINGFKPGEREKNIDRLRGFIDNDFLQVLKTLRDLPGTQTEQSRLRENFNLTITLLMVPKQYYADKIDNRMTERTK